MTLSSLSVSVAHSWWETHAPVGAGSAQLRQPVSRHLWTQTSPSTQPRPSETGAWTMWFSLQLTEMVMSPETHLHKTISVAYHSLCPSVSLYCLIGHWVKKTKESEEQELPWRLELKPLLPSSRQIFLTEVPSTSPGRSPSWRKGRSFHSFLAFKCFLSIFIKWLNDVM